VSSPAHSLLQCDLSRLAEFEALRRLGRDLPPIKEFSDGSRRELDRSGLVISASHEAAHVRNGYAKQAEAGTAVLAFAVARHLGAAAICTADPQPGDPNWDKNTGYQRRVRDLARTAPVMDIHMMRPRKDVDVGIGLGPRPELAEGMARHLVDELERTGLRGGLNVPFRAAGVTLTAQLQRSGISAMQIEFSYRCFSPGRPEMPLAWTAFARAVARTMNRRYEPPVVAASDGSQQC
jgi:hypothetical protein